MSRDLNDTLVFVKVVELGSFTAAGRALHLPKTSVSRKVQDLEERLGAQLLHRTTRKLGLTEAGSIYFEHCRGIARELDEAESAVGQLQGGPRGWLRVTATHAVGNIWLGPLLGEFHARNPEVHVGCSSAARTCCAGACAWTCPAASRATSCCRICPRSSTSTRNWKSS